MVLSHEDDESAHPYWYARIIGIFHVDVRHTGPDSRSMDTQSMEFLWVRWFGYDIHHCAGWATRRLHRVGFIPSDDVGAFGFLDPKDVIRGVHLIPAFAHGRTDELLPLSIARQPKDHDRDWVYYYVMM